MPTAADFELGEGTRADLEAMMEIMRLAWETDGVWHPLMRDVSPEDEQAFLVDLFGLRFLTPDNTFFKITEKATGKIVAFTSLYFPYTLTEEQKAISHQSPVPPKGMNMAIWDEFIMSVENPLKNGCDPEKDFQRKATMVHPDYQKQGHGSRLTRHCNQFADKVGRPSYVVARPSSRPMFDKLGYKVVDDASIPIEKYGGEEGGGKFWCLKREPQAQN